VISAPSALQRASSVGQMSVRPAKGVIVSESCETVIGALLVSCR